MIDPTIAFNVPQIAALYSNDALRRTELQMVAEECGFDIRDNNSHADMLLIDLHSISDMQDKELLNILSYLRSSSAEALIWTDMDRLDVAYALFPATRCHFLVDASKAEAVHMLTRASRRGRMDQLHDSGREDGFQELHKIRDEVASLADALAKLASRDGTDGNTEANSLADKPVSFRPAPTAATSPFIEEPRAATGAWSAKEVRNVIRLRRLREQFFANDLFADPAWDILLDLMAARLEGTRVSVSSLCIAAAVPATTALRWITTMTDNGMLERQLDPKDARRVFIELSEDTISRLESYFTEIRAQDPVI